MSRPGSRTLTDDEVKTLETLLSKLAGPGAELPWPLFRFINEVIATVNVDLVVVDPERGTLLSWRDDPFGKGWHVPGSIIRHREEIRHRIVACARDEFGCDVDTSEQVAAVIQIFDDRGHSVSLCYRATLRGEPGQRVVGAGAELQPGDLRWFRTPPADLYPSHLVYRDVLAAMGRGELDQGAPLFSQHIGRRDAGQASPEGSIDTERGIA